MTTIRIADLFCGAGGTSTGAVQAARNLAHAVKERKPEELFPVGEM